MTEKTGIVDTLAAFTPKGALVNNPAPEIALTPSVQTPFTPDELIARMDESGIEQCIIPGRRYGRHWGVPYDVLAEFVSHHPDRLFATAGISPTEGIGGVRSFETAVRDNGFIGAHCYPAWTEMAADDRLFYPYYAKAEELGVPFQIECSRSGRGPFSCKPDHIARITWDFPGLVIVAFHTGWPWIDDLVAVARGNRNIYICCDISPNVWTPALLDFIRGDQSSATSERVLYGTSGRPETIPSFRKLVDDTDLPPDVQQRLFAENARNLYGTNKTG